MKKNVADAAAHLQSLISKYETRDYWLTEQAEEAFNILLTQPERLGESHALVRNALSDAGKKLKRRSKIYGAFTPDCCIEEQSYDFEQLLIETSDVLARLASNDQELLGLAFEGHAANDVAERSHRSISQARERLSRARRRARSARDAA